jgi:putative glutamine amidotransferase
VLPRPVIGVALETQEPIPTKLPLSWSISQVYVRVLASAGAVPWLIAPLGGDEPLLRAIHERLDGIFLAGGVDVEPRQYLEQRHALCGEVDPDRDWAELNLVRWAAADGKPILGICRGVQAINVALGGSLYQDIRGMAPHASRHDYFTSPGDAGSRAALVHDVRITPGSRLARILGVESARANSMHHQAIKQLAPGLVATAFAPDGLIEGVEASGAPFLIGVQWHPEELVETQAEMRGLFTAFVEAARRSLPPQRQRSADGDHVACAHFP